MRNRKVKSDIKGGVKHVKKNVRRMLSTLVLTSFIAVTVIAFAPFLSFNDLPGSFQLMSGFAWAGVGTCGTKPGSFTFTVVCSLENGICFPDPAPSGKTGSCQTKNAGRTGEKCECVPHKNQVVMIDEEIPGGEGIPGAGGMLA
jgi:hypothetical protein